MANITYGPKLNKVINADIGDKYPDDLRAFLRSYDALVQGSVIDVSLTTPPTTPSNGDAYIVATGATGAWLSKDKYLAVYSTEITTSNTNTKTPNWEFYTPQAGWQFYVTALHTFYSFDGTIWATAGGGLPAQKTVTTNYTVTPADNIIFVDATSNNITITLPSLTPTSKGESVTVKRIDNSSNYWVRVVTASFSSGTQ